MMNKKLLFAALAAVLSLSFVACDNDEKEENEPVNNPVVSLAGDYEGWTLGSNAYAPYIPSEGDRLSITLTNAEGTLCNLTYASETWGTTTLTDVAIEQNDTAFVFSKPITAIIRQDHSAWDFSATPDSIAMPNRNPQGGGATVSNYPIVLTSGYMLTGLDKWQIDFKAYLVPRSEHTMTMSFRNGSIPAVPQK